MSRNSKLIEQWAVNVIEGIALDTQKVIPALNKNDKEPIFDGYFIVYKDRRVDIKDNIDFYVPTQIKGRSGEYKNTISIQRGCVQGYLRGGHRGVVLFVCFFPKNNREEYVLGYRVLTTHEIYRILDENTGKKNIQVELARVEKDEANNAMAKAFLEFNYNTEVQRKTAERVLSRRPDGIIGGSAVEFGAYGRNSSEIMLDIVSKEKTVYQRDKEGKVINVAKMRFDSVINMTGISASTADGKCVLPIKQIMSRDGVSLSVGAGFRIDENMQIKYRTRGTLDERIRDLEFLEKMYDDKFVYVNGKKIGINDDILGDGLDVMVKIKERYIRIRNGLCGHNVMRDIALDEWSDQEITRLDELLKAIDNHEQFRVKTDEANFLKMLTIHDLKFLLMGEKAPEGEYYLSDVFLDKALGQFFVEFDNGERKSITPYLALNSRTLQADNVDLEAALEEIKKSEADCSLCQVINSSALAAITAYDVCVEDRFLNYAIGLVDYAASVDIKNNTIYKINKFQILKRRGELSGCMKKEIISIKNSTQDVDIKIECCALLGYADEAEALLESAEKKIIDGIYSDPISHFLPSREY